VFASDFLQAAVGHAAFHLGCDHRLHRSCVQLGKALAKAQAQPLVHFSRYQADQGQHQVQASRPVREPLGRPGLAYRLPGPV
jgi:hypothetical protein